MSACSAARASKRERPSNCASWAQVLAKHFFSAARDTKGPSVTSADVSRPARPATASASSTAPRAEVARVDGCPTTGRSGPGQARVRAWQSDASWVSGTCEGATRWASVTSSTGQGTSTPAWQVFVIDGAAGRSAPPSSQGSRRVSSSGSRRPASTSSKAIQIGLQAAGTPFAGSCCMLARASAATSSSLDRQAVGTPAPLHELGA